MHLEFLFFSPPHGCGIIRDLLSIIVFVCLLYSLPITEMSLLLASLPVTAAINSALPVNLLCSKRAAVHNVHNTTSLVELPVTVSFLNQEFTTQLPFQIFHEDIGFEVVFGSQWESWCILNKGQLNNLFFCVLT